MDKPYVYITRRLPEEELAVLKEIANVNMWEKEDTPVPRDILLEEAGKADALLTMLTESVDRELLDASKRLKIVSNMAVGYDNIDVSYATEKGILIGHTPDILTDTTADLTFGLLMATARRMAEASEYVKEGKWTNWAPFLLAGTDVHHKTIGIIGMGRIGEAVAKRASGFEMNILYHNRRRKTDAEKELGARYCSFDELLASSDFVVCMTPFTPETEGMFNRNVFRKMKKTAIFINASRGGVVNESDLYDALREKEIAGAGLDVFCNEPIGSDHPLLSLPNVVALPHIGSATMETRLKMVRLAVENVTGALTGKKDMKIVNKELVK